MKAIFFLVVVFFSTLSFARSRVELSDGVETWPLSASSEELSAGLVKTCIYKVKNVFGTEVFTAESVSCAVACFDAANKCGAAYLVGCKKVSCD